MLIIQNSKVFYRNEIYISTSVYVINIYNKERTQKIQLHLGVVIPRGGFSLGSSPGFLDHSLGRSFPFLSRYRG